MATKTKARGKRATRVRARGTRNSTSGHPSLKELMEEQGTGPISDVRVLRGDFWPEDERIEDFLATLREWRGHKHN